MLKSTSKEKDLKKRRKALVKKGNDVTLSRYDLILDRNELGPHQSKQRADLGREIEVQEAILEDINDEIADIDRELSALRHERA